MKKLQFIVMLFIMIAGNLYGKHEPLNFILINEIKMYGTTHFSDEFIELFNVTDSLFDISRYKILYFNGDGSMRKVIHDFPDSTFIKPYHYYLLATVQYTEAKTPDAIMEHGLLSSGQLILVDSSCRDTLDAVAWGNIETGVTNEGMPAEYVVPVETPPVSPELGEDLLLSVQRFPEGTDTNNNLADFKVRYFTSPMNSRDSLNMIDPASLQAIKSSDKIIIQWKTFSITKDLHFNIYMKTADENNWRIIDPARSLLMASIKDTHTFRYEMVVDDLLEDFLCKIQEIDFTGTPRFTSIFTIEADIIEKPQQVVHILSLEQNYPNPFNPVTTISFSLIEESYLTIKIYNMLGREVKTLAESNFNMGDQKLLWDGTDNYGKKVPSGEYFIMLRTQNNRTAVKKMIVHK